MDISIVVPLYNEEESLTELITWIHKIMEQNQFSYEVVMIDDGSTDGSWKVIENLSKQFDQIKGIKFRRNYGKSAALNTAFRKVKGDVVITMDADLQDSPDEIPGLYKMIKEDGYDLVSGWKKKRFDPLMKTIPTKLFNWAQRKMSGIYLHDFNCGLKSYRIDVVKNIEVQGDMHRYIPFIAKTAGFANIGERVVQHQARKHGVSKFGMERFINGFLDLFTITFVSRFSKKPMHLFGAFGSIMFIIGTLGALYLGIHKLFINVNDERITELPAFYIALTCIVLGTQLFLAGFIGELIIRNTNKADDYQIESLFGED